MWRAADLTQTWVSGLCVSGVNSCRVSRLSSPPWLTSPSTSTCSRSGDLQRLFSSFNSSVGVTDLFALLLQIYEAIDNRDGSICAELLSFKHPHVANPRLQVRPHPLRYSVSIARKQPHLCLFLWQLLSPEEKCQQVLELPYDEMVAAHLRCGRIRWYWSVMEMSPEVTGKWFYVCVCFTGAHMQWPITTLLKPTSSRLSSFNILQMFEFKLQKTFNQ